MRRMPGSGRKSRADDLDYRCNDCGETKPKSEFHKNPRVPSGVRANCKDCSRNHQRARRYGISVAEIKKFLKKRHYACEVCGETERIHLDHDHETGALRGLLCQKCNQALGLMEDNPDLLRSLALYVERDPR